MDVVESNRRGGGLMDRNHRGIGFLHQGVVLFRGHSEALKQALTIQAQRDRTVLQQGLLPTFLRATHQFLTRHAEFVAR